MVLTLSPVRDAREEVKAGDIVFVRWRPGRYMLHLVGETRDDSFLIVNGEGRKNGWTEGANILGRLSNIEDSGKPDIPALIAAHQTPETKVFVY